MSTYNGWAKTLDKQIACYSQQAKPLPETKLCRRCGETKPRSAFHTCWKKSNSFQLRSACKPCHAKKTRAWINATGYRPKVDPVKHRAQMALRRAVKAGKITRLEKCEHCPSTHRLHAHHDDYSRPLDVVWLCSPCHAMRHKHLTDIKMRLLGAMEPA